MIKVVSLLRRKEGLTHEEFVRHWLEIHAPLIRMNPEVRRYVQSHIVSERVRHGATIEAEIDGIAELWYDDLEALARSGKSELSKTVSADTAKFIGASKSFIIEEKIIVELR